MENGTVLHVKWTRTTPTEYTLTVNDGRGQTIAQSTYPSDRGLELESECAFIIAAVKQFYAELIEWS